MELERDKKGKIVESAESLNSTTILEVPSLLDLTTHRRNLKKEKQMKTAIGNVRRKTGEKEIRKIRRILRRRGKGKKDDR